MAITDTTKTLLIKKTFKQQTIMAVMYKLRQEKNPKSKFKGQWYARAIAIETVDTATDRKSVV